MRQSTKNARKSRHRKSWRTIGNLPYLGDMEHEDNEYVFPLHVRLPRVIFDESRQTPQDVKFLSSKRVGEIRVNAESGEVNRTRIHDIKSNIRQQKRVVEEAVQKALVRSSARKFSKLPFPELRYTPILDILSQLLIEGLIRRGRNRVDE